MDKFLSAHGTGSSWAYATKECVDGLVDGQGNLPALKEGMSWLGFVYITDVFSADISSILTYLRQKTGITHWAGTIGSGVLIDAWEYHDLPAVGAMVGQFPEDSFRILPPLHDLEEALPEQTLRWFKDVSPCFGIVHGDPSCEGVITLIEALAQTMGGILGGSFLVGGLTASRGENFQIADKLTGNGVSGVAFAPHVSVITGLSQGCLPLGGTHLVTDAVDNVIMGLDGVSALDVLKEDVGELLSRDLSRLSGFVHAAIPVTGSDTGDYMVRNLTAIDPDRGWLAIGDMVAPGDRVSFVRRDPPSARADMDRMLEDIKSRMPSQPKGALYFSCVARGPLMFGTSGEEARILRAALGNIPIVGFFGNGEISNSRLHRFTGVLVLFF